MSLLYSFDLMVGQLVYLTAFGTDSQSITAKLQTTAAFAHPSCLTGRQTGN